MIEKIIDMDDISIYHDADKIETILLVKEIVYIVFKDKTDFEPIHGIPIIKSNDHTIGIPLSYNMHLEIKPVLDILIDRIN